jgi:adenine phosphoribosyltransferase
MEYKDALKFYPDFPIPGVNFVDIIPLMQDKELFRKLIGDIADACSASAVAAPEARGFLFAAPLLVQSDKIDNVVPIRKKGKLPHAEGDLIGVSIHKEYGSDQLYFRLSDIAAGHPEGDVFRISFFDDVLATGGTAKGVAEGLMGQKVLYQGKEYGIEVVDFVFLAELDALEGRKLLEPIAPVKSLIHL